MHRHPSLAPGTPMGPYVLAEPLGVGSSAVVFRATRGDREVAVKVRTRGDPELDRRFLREFETLRGLALPGVVRVFDAGLGDQWLWYAMERVRGEPLRTWMHQADDVPGRVARLLQIAAPLCDTLAGVHRAGLVHRDLKPGNVLVDELGVPHVLDFGVVRGPAEAEDPITREGGLVGTLPFMAPEQVAGSPVTQKADLFALGLLFYEGIAGRRPRPARPQDWLRIQILERPRSLALLDAAVPRPVSTIVDRLLALDPDDRPDAAEAAVLFRACAVGGGPSGWPSPSRYVGEPAALTMGKRLVRGEGPRLMVLAGPAGSGRRRAAEQLRRRALLAGWRTVRGRCRVERPGRALGEVLASLLASPADEAWRARVAAADTRALLEMWPELPLSSPGGAHADGPPEAADVVSGCVRTLCRVAGDDGLLVVLEDLDEVDGLSARVVEELARTAPPNVALIATMDTRYATRRSRRLLDTLRESGHLVEPPMTDLGVEDARALAAEVAPPGVTVDIGACSPLRAVEAGLDALAKSRGEPFPTLPSSAFPGALAEDALPVVVWEALGVRMSSAAPALRSVDRDRLAVRDEVVRAGALARLANRAAAAHRLAEAWQAFSGPERHAARARALLLAEDAAAAFEPAVLAALEAERAGHYREAQDWLLLVDALPRDRASEPYTRLRFPLAACRAAVALHSGSERPRADLLALAAQRASTSEERRQVALLHIDLLRREGDLRGALVGAMKLGGRADVPPDDAADALLRAAELRLELGQPRDARVHLDRAEQLRGGWRGDVRQVLLDQARAEVELSTGELDLALQICQRAVRLATGLPFPRGLARVYRQLATAQRLRGERLQAEEAAARARALLLESGERAAAAEATIQVGWLALGRGDPAAARLFSGEALATARRLGRRRLLLDALALALEVAAVRRDSEAATAVLAEAASLGRRTPTFAVAELRWWRAVGDHERALAAAEPLAEGGWTRAEMELELARVRAELGDVASAAPHLERGEQIARAGGFGELLLYARVLRGALQLDRDESWPRVFAEALRSRHVELVLLAIAADAARAARRGDADTATTRWRELAARAEEHGHAPWRAATRESLT